MPMLMVPVVYLSLVNADIEDRLYFVGLAIPTTELPTWNRQLFGEEYRTVPSLDGSGNPTPGRTGSFNFGSDPTADELELDVSMLNVDQKAAAEALRDSGANLEFSVDGGITRWEVSLRPGSKNPEFTAHAKFPGWWRAKFKIRKVGSLVGS